MAKIETQTGETSKSSTPDISVILSRLDKLETENKTLTKKLAETTENKFVKAKEKYKGPRKNSYKMWGGIPVLSYESVKKDTTKDWLYKNQYGEMTSNHYLKLTLADETTVEVEVNDFNGSFTRSDKLECEVIGDGVSTTGYKFKDDQYKEFIVKPNIIN